MVCTFGRIIFFPEIIDPQTGEVLPDGELGELVFTSLSKEAFPIVRYRTRDLTRLLPGTARTMRRMQKVTGRSDDMIILRGVNIFPTQVEEQLLKVTELAAHFQIELIKKGPMDHMIVHVEGSQNASDELAKLIKANIGVTAEVKAGKKNTVPRSQGKAVRVIDNRQNG
jgi:phenylacetate-CoA ligase